MKQVAHVSSLKKKQVTQLSAYIAKHKIIGVVNMEGLPASQLARLRHNLRKDAYMYMSKRKLIEIAIEENKGKHKGLEGLKEHLGGMPALLFSDSDPFAISRFIRKNKSNAAIKPGQTAPHDLIVPAGPTPFAPGPIISELANVGIKAGIEGGKVSVKFDATILRAGEKANQKQAEVLAKFGIEPMEIGLDLVAVYDDGIIYGKSVLGVDDKHYIMQIAKASNEAMAIALEAAYTTKDTIGRLLGLAVRSARAVSTKSAFPTADTIGDILGRAEREAIAINQKTQS